MAEKKPSGQARIDLSTLPVDNLELGSTKFAKKRHAEADTQVRKLRSLKRHKPMSSGHAKAPSALDFTFNYWNEIPFLANRDACTNLFHTIGVPSGMPPIDNLAEADMYRDLSHNTT